MDTIFEFDIETLRFLHHNRFEWLDTFFQLVSNYTTYVTVVIFFILFFLYFKNRSNEFKWKIISLLIIVVTSAVSSNLLKLVFARPRPFKEFTDILKLSSGGSYSFPSGHTAEVFGLAFGFWLIFKNPKFSIPLFIWASIVAYSRICLGVHYPLDILGSIILTYIISFLINKYLLLKKLSSH